MDENISRVISVKQKRTPMTDMSSELARPKGLEPLTYSLGGYRSIHLSYGRNMGRLVGFEPTMQEPQSCVLTT